MLVGLFAALVLQSDTVIIADKVQCRTCAIAVDSGPVIRSVPRVAELTMGTRLVRTRTRSFIASELPGRTALAEFDSLGTFVRRLDIGISPASPAGGMLQFITASDDGTIHVADEFFARVAPTGSLIGRRTRLFPAPGPQIYDIVAFSESVSVVQAMVPVRGGAHSFHLVDGRGAIVRGFGEAKHVVFLEGFGATKRRLARGTGGTFWSVPPNRYELTLWDTAGRVRQHLRIGSSWFTPWDERLRPPDIRTERWPTVVQGVATDRRGLVWVISWVRNSAWIPPRSAFALDSARARTRLSRAEYSERINSIVEIIDPTCGVLVARRVVPLALLGFVANSALEPTSIVQDHSEAEGTSFTVLTLTLDRTPAPSSRSERCAW